jgi:hypothetical protein
MVTLILEKSGVSKDKINFKTKIGLILDRSCLTAKEIRYLKIKTI